MADTILNRIKDAMTAHTEKHGTNPKLLMLGAEELGEFIREFCPTVDENEDAVQGTQMTTVFGMRLATVLKIKYLGVA